MPYAVPQFSYDTETGELRPLKLSTPGNFAGWTDDDRLLLRTVFQTVGDSTLPRSLISYDLAAEETVTLLDAKPDGWVGEVSQNGDWIAVIHYQPARGYGAAGSGGLRLIYGEEVFDHNIDYASHTPSFYTELLSWSPNGRWLTVDSTDALYQFDTQTGDFDALSSYGSIDDRVFWSPTSRFTAFQAGERFRLWDAESNAIDGVESLPDGISALIGWRGGDQQVSLTCLHGYRDGNV
jgi:WD40 repeat protein